MIGWRDTERKLRSVVASFDQMRHNRASRIWGNGWRIRRCSPGTAMKLTLTLMRNDDPNGSPIDTRSFDDRGLTLGRGGDNDWVLYDPNRHLSKSHCAIEFEGGEFIVTDISTNGVFLNQLLVTAGCGNAMGLRDGDMIGLGEYLVRVEIATVDAGAGDAVGDDFDDFGDGFEAASGLQAGSATADPFATDAD